MNSISVCEEENVEFITVELPGVVVHSLYKPPPEPFLLPPLGQRIKPHIVIGDFNSHSTLWGYTTTDSDGEAVEQWADSNRLSLIHNAKLPKSLNSAIWKKGYNPDLIFVSSNISDMCEKSVLDQIPRTQYRPICVTVHPVIVPQPTPFRRRFNLRKAKWDDFSTDFDEAIDKLSPRLQTTQPTSGGAVTVVSSCCANCVEPPRPQQWGPDLPFFGHAGHADPLDGWRCCSQKRVMSRPIQVRQL